MRYFLPLLFARPRKKYDHEAVEVAGVLIMFLALMAAVGSLSSVSSLFQRGVATAVPVQGSPERAHVAFVPACSFFFSGTLEISGDTEQCGGPSKKLMELRASQRVSLSLPFKKYC